MFLGLLVMLFQIGAFESNLSTFFLNSFPLIAIGFIISASLTALLYMAGTTLESQDLVAMGKENLSNFIFSAIIVLMFFVFFAIFSEVASAFACSVPCSHLEAAYQSMIMLKLKTFSLYLDLYFYEIVFGFLSTLSVNLPAPAFDPISFLGFKLIIPQFSIAPFSGLTPLSTAHTIVLEAVGTGVFLVLVREVLLDFIMKYTFIFFIFGAILRSFSFTSRTGSGILAITAVMFFIYPLSALLTNYLVFQAYEPTNFGVVPTAIGFCDNSKDLMMLSQAFSAESEALYETEIPKSKTPWYFFGEHIWSGIKFMWESGKELLKVLLLFNLLVPDQGTNIIFSPFSFSTLIDFFFIEIQTLAQFIVLIFVSFVIEIIISITMYRAIASVIDAETEIFGINKLI